MSVIVDGNRQSFHMGRDDTSILDAALENGVELPYSCKGGVLFHLPNDAYEAARSTWR